MAKPEQYKWVLTSYPLSEVVSLTFSRIARPRKYHFFEAYSEHNLTTRAVFGSSWAIIFKEIKKEFQTVVI